MVSDAIIQSNPIRQIAQDMKRLTYDEMMAVSEFFAAWTSARGGGVYETPTIGPDAVAANLSDWADGILAANP